MANVDESANEDGQSMINDYQYEKNSYSDSQFMKDFIEKEEEHPKENALVVVTDGAYTSVENTGLAEKKGIEHVPTELCGRRTEDICADFTFNEDGTEIVTCPNGVSPKKCGYYANNEQVRAVFDKECCEGCPHREECHPLEQQKTTVKKLSAKSTARAKMKRRQTGTTFEMRRKFRNGSEAVPAAMRQKYDVDNMPVRGLIRTRHLFGFKIGGLATVKFLRFKKCQKRPLEKCA